MLSSCYHHAIIVSSPTQPSHKMMIA